MEAKLQFPPGLDRTGTEYQAAGRWYFSDLVRWFLGRLRPIGGWTSLATGLTGQVSGLHTWVDNSANGLCAIGTDDKLYTMVPAGTLTDRTPSGYTPQDETSTWTFDNAGQLLLGVNDAEGVIYKFLPGTDTLATALSAEGGASGVPTAKAIHVTNEGIPVALGANGDPRLVKWADRDDITDWTAGLTDLAGDLVVQSSAGLLAARKVRAGSLIWTPEDLHIMRYVGLPDVYGIDRVAGECGAISRHAMMIVDDVAFWMGPTNFKTCLGGSMVDDLPCMVHDDVYLDLDVARAHLVRAVHVAEFKEIWWLYRKSGDTGTTNTRAVVYNYREKTWALHVLSRHDGIGRGKGFTKPMLIAGSAVYQHETGQSRLDGGTPRARSGPNEIGLGKKLMHVRRCIPDELTQGDCDIYFHSRLFPNGDETTHGPYSAGTPTNVRFCGRQVAIELREAENNDWRVGDYRLEGEEGSER